MNTSWDLTHIYPSEEAFLEDLKVLKDEIVPALGSYQGKLGNEESLKEFLSLERKEDLVLSKLYTYASTLSDLDRKNTHSTELESKVDLVLQELIRATSFEEPEILSIGREKIDEFLKKNPECNDFSFAFQKLFDGQRHVLSLDAEKLLSNYSPILGEAGELYSVLSVADYSPKKVTLSNGEEVSVSQSNWTTLVKNAECEEDRKAIFETLYSYFDSHKTTYAEIYNLGLQSQLATMRARNYSSIPETHLDGNNVPLSVMETLFDVASKNSAPLKKYYEIRRKYLGLEKHRSYDRFIELAKSDDKFTYEEAREMFYDSIKGFSKDYQEKAREVTKEGYVDVYPASGKRTGAYSTGGSGVHPYILLNFNGELDDVFTLAHESGHSVHTLYSMEAQPLMKSNYTIFVAEIASTFNEHNLLDYLLKKGTLSKSTRIALLQKAIDEICSTFYRQALFGQYEYEIAKKVENGEPINYEVLSDKMSELYMTYFGIDIKEEVYKPLVWAYIPHLFYTPFYVYQYATSYTASMLLYKNFKEGKPGAFENHINLLKSGGSEYPIDQVKKAGVDLTSKEPYMAVVNRMKELVDELEKALND